MNSSSSKRRLRRFFYEGELPGEGKLIRLSVPETRHLQKTLRLKEGDECLIADGCGREGRASVSRFAPDGCAELQMMEISDKNPAAAGFQLRICQAILQKGKMDELVQKAQELGASEIWPLETERSQVRMEPAQQAKVLERWRKIAQEAAKQSGSGRLIKIARPESFKQAWAAMAEEKLAAVFHPSPAALPFRKWVDRLDPAAPVRLNLFLGPEGGFSEKEMAAVESSRKNSKGNIQIVSLGPSILKADTAFIGVLAALRFLLPTSS